MSNQNIRKLRLSKETIRELLDEDLERIAGGQAQPECPSHTQGLCTSSSKEKCDTTICGIRGK